MEPRECLEFSLVKYPKYIANSYGNARIFFMAKDLIARHQGMKKNNLPTIVTKDLRIEEISKLNSKEFNKKEELGILKRIEKI